MATDFPGDLLDRADHRPWPLPDGPWIMTQSWHDLLFAHWPVKGQELRDRLPAGLELDLFDGQAWLGVIPFRMTNVGPRGVPALPFVSAFHELNVRTYVSRDGKPGVWFFSLDADSQLAVATARTLFRLPYFHADMDLRQDAAAVAFHSRRRENAGAPAALDVRYEPSGPALPPEPGSLEYFLTERYCLYTVDSSLHLYRLDIHHPRWPLQPAAAAFDVNTMAAAAGVALPDIAPFTHFARRQDALAWPLVRI